MKVGIYSGTFDPVHKGHINFVKEAIEQCGLDKVFFLAEPRPRRKQGVKAFEHRVNMLNMAVSDDPKLGLIILEQPRFTPRETMPLILARFKDVQLYMLMGDDMLDHFTSWPHVGDIVSSIRFIIGLRKYDAKHVEAIAKTLKQVKGLDLDYELFQPTHYKLSSSGIKSSIKKRADYNGLNGDVAKYIKENGLYSDGSK